MERADQDVTESSTNGKEARSKNLNHQPTQGCEIWRERESGVTTRSRTHTKYVKVSEARGRDDELEDEWVEEPEDSHDPEGEDKLKGGDVPPPKQCPLIIKGGDTAYIPWTFMDMTGLIGRLPSICDGAQKWITWFKEQTTGQHLALGDIKAILSQTLGKAKMTEILDQADLKKTADDPHYDHPLGPWKTAIWDAMRKTYPTKTDPGKVEKVKLGDDEGVAQFILKLQTIWREEMDAPWDETAASQALFKVMLKRALPSEVQEQLEIVVGLNAMPWDTFEANIIHYVELHRKKEREARKAAENLLMQLHKAQLGEQTRNKQEGQEKKKEKKEENVAKQAAVIVTPTATQAIPAPVMNPHPGVAPQQVPVLYQNPPNMMGYPAGPQYPQRPQGWRTGRGRGKEGFP
ncbi:hypothetical protein QTP86_009155 [Hemibagrus guttatus]|nr:hypothetical protein QTP86_009155 [Hemibagrus guttatus]